MIRLFNRYWALPAAVSLAIEALLLFAAVPLVDPAPRSASGPGTPPPSPPVAAGGRGVHRHRPALPLRQQPLRLRRAAVDAGADDPPAADLLDPGGRLLGRSTSSSPTVQTGRGVFALALALRHVVRARLARAAALDPALGGVRRARADRRRRPARRSTSPARPCARSTWATGSSAFSTTTRALQGVSILNPAGRSAPPAQACELALPARRHARHRRRHGLPRPAQHGLAAQVQDQRHPRPGGVELLRAAHAARS